MLKRKTFYLQVWIDLKSSYITKESKCKWKERKLFFESPLETLNETSFQVFNQFWPALTHFPRRFRYFCVFWFLKEFRLQEILLITCLVIFQFSNFPWSDNFSLSTFVSSFELTRIRTLLPLFSFTFPTYSRHRLSFLSKISFGICLSVLTCIDSVEKFCEKLVGYYMMENPRESMYFRKLRSLESLHVQRSKLTA